MAERFDARKIATLKVADGTRKDFFDETLTGFGLRVSALGRGRKTWFLGYRINGRGRKFTIGTYPSLSLADARDRAKALLGDIAKGIDPMEIKHNDRKAETFQELADDYIEKHAKRETVSWHETRRKLYKDVIPRIGARKAKEIKKSDVLDIVDQVMNRGSKVEANHILKTIKRVYNWSIERGLIETNPCWGIKKPHKELPKDRVLTATEIKKVWEACEAEMYDEWSGTKKDKIKVKTIIQLYLTTAQRGKEIKTAEWSEVDLDNHLWTIPKEKMKNRQPHLVPLNAMSLKLFRELKMMTGQDRHCFPSPYVADANINNFQKAVERVRERSGVNFSAHDLRRTVASHLTGMGTPRLVVDKLLSHVCGGIGAVYDRHDYFHEKVKALAVWNDRLGEIVAGRTDFSREEDKMVYSKLRAL
jgi:integrase